MNIRLACCISLLWVIGLVPVRAQGFLHARGQSIVDGQERPVILRGMGLGGWML